MIASIQLHARKAAWAAFALAGLSCAAAAQTLPTPTNAAVPPTVGSPLPGIAPPPRVQVQPATPPAPPVVPSPVAPGQAFAIDDAAVTGATAYPASDMAAVVQGLTGPAVPLDRIEAARAALLTRYRQSGYTYATVRVRIHERHLRMVVTEPHVTGVKLDHDIGPAGSLVLRFLGHLADGRLLSERDLERWVLLANDIPGVTVRAVLDPSQTDPGALILVARVERRAVAGSLRADNRAFRLTGPEELLATADLNSFTSFGEKTEVTLYHTFNNTDTFGQVSEDFFIGGSGLRAHLYFGDGESIPSGTLRQLGYDGITRVFGGSLAYPVIRDRLQSLELTAQFDGVESDISYTVQGPGKRASFDSLRILRLNADDTLSEIWAGARFPAIDTTGLTLSQGLPGLGATANGEKQLPRLNERVDFTKIFARADRVQTLFPWFSVQGQQSIVQLELAAQGQYSGNILPPEEKFYLGGPTFDRGFYYGEVTGDSALTAKAEPQLVTALPTLPYTHIIPQAVFYVFYDWGETWEQQRQDLNHRLSSLGGGVRLGLGDHAEIDVEGVSRLTRDPTPSQQNSRLKSSAVYWQVVGRF